jgi:hypothetical protein
MKMKKKSVVTIASKNKLLCAPLTDEAKSVLRRKPLEDRKLLRILNSTDQSSMPDSAQCRMLALDALYLRGFKIFDEVH